MSFNPNALSERTMKQFVDRLLKHLKDQPAPLEWPPKRHTVQEHVAILLGFSNWHTGIHAVRSSEAPEKVPPATSASPPPSMLSPISALPFYPDEPARFTPKDMDKLLAWASHLGASDITFSTNEQVFVEHLGKMSRATKRELGYDEVRNMVAYLAGHPGPIDNSIDVAHEVHMGEFKHRFRINATSITLEGTRGYQITCRAVPTNPPTLKVLDMEKLGERVGHLKQGLVVITGGTGSGKSTTIAGLVQELTRTKEGRILTYDSPIEYEYKALSTQSSIAQHEIGRDVRSFPEGIKNALRRKPSVIVIGEARDVDTITEAVNAARTGHLVVLGLHSPSVSNAIRRLINVFPAELRAEHVPDVLQNLRVISSQMLVPTTKGTRVALQETLVLNDDVIDRLIRTPFEMLAKVVDTMLAEQGEGFLLHARQKYAEGIIDKKIVDNLERDFAARMRRG